MTTHGRGPCCKLAMLFAALSVLCSRVRSHLLHLRHIQPVPHPLMKARVTRVRIRHTSLHLSARLARERSQRIVQLTECATHDSGRLICPSLLLRPWKAVRLPLTLQTRTWYEHKQNKLFISPSNGGVDRHFVYVMWIGKNPLLGDKVPKDSTPRAKWHVCALYLFEPCPRPYILPCYPKSPQSSFYLVAGCSCMALAVGKDNIFQVHHAGLCVQTWQGQPHRLLESFTNGVLQLRSLTWSLCSCMYSINVMRLPRLCSTILRHVWMWLGFAFFPNSFIPHPFLSNSARSSLFAQFIWEWNWKLVNPRTDGGPGHPSTDGGADNRPPEISKTKQARDMR